MKGAFHCHCSYIYRTFIMECDLEHKSDKSSSSLVFAFCFVLFFLCQRYASLSGSNMDVLFCSVESLNVHKLICVCV